MFRKALELELSRLYPNINFKTVSDEYLLEQLSILCSQFKALLLVSEQVHNVYKKVSLHTELVAKIS